MIKTIIITALLGLTLTAAHFVPGMGIDERRLNELDMSESEMAGHSYLDKLAQLEDDLIAKGVYVNSRNARATPTSCSHMAKFKKASAEAIEMQEKGIRMLEAAKSMKEQLGLADKYSGHKLRSVTAGFSVINNTCLVVPTCTNSSKYRTADGSCNNLNIPNLGQSNTVYRRLVPPLYKDGIQIPRILSNGTKMASPRVVSMAIFQGCLDMQPNITMAFMEWGQFINHDMEFTPQFSFGNGTKATGTDIQCCTSDYQLIDPSLTHPACMAIEVDVNDKFYTNKKCMNFVRSIAGPRIDCSVGYADQLNSNTHWLDGSAIYGSSAATTASLRQFSGGLLKMSTDTANGNRQLLPIAPQTCKNGACFVAGDSRVSVQPQLAVLQTVMAREHNRVASQLQTLNPTWTDENLFQEARRIVSAEIQHITYNEFLTLLIGPKISADMGLNPLKSGYFTNYTSVTSGPVSNEFATAAFRMGHSLVRGLVQLYNEQKQLLSCSYNMSFTFNDARPLQQCGSFLDNTIRGLANQFTEEIDNNVDSEIWHRLFNVLDSRGNRIRDSGFDIVSLNIQRGRDHGLQSYNTYRQLCGQQKLTNFSDFTTTLRREFKQITNLTEDIMSLYGNVDDIDLYVGNLIERSYDGGLVGRTLKCLIGENFRTLKTSDRFYYELGNQLSSFSPAQLDSIRNATLARIFCDNSDGTVKAIQPEVMVLNNGTSVRVNCSSLPFVDLSLWKGEPVSQL